MAGPHAISLGAGTCFDLLQPFCPRPGFQKRLGQRLLTAGRIAFQINFAEFFAELCAPEAPIMPLRSCVLH